MATVGSYCADRMPTTTQIDEKTREELIRYVSGLQARTGRKVTFDEVIRALIKETKDVKRARDKLDYLFGTLAGDGGLWRELEATRKKERKFLEGKA